MPMKGSYNFLAVDERFAPWLFLIRSSSEDLLQKIPELRSEEHTSELQSRLHLVCRLLLERNSHFSGIRPLASRMCVFETRPVVTNLMCSRFRFELTSARTRGSRSRTSCLASYSVASSSTSSCAM